MRDFSDFGKISQGNIIRDGETKVDNVQEMFDGVRGAVGKEDGARSIRLRGDGRIERCTVQRQKILVSLDFFIVFGNYCDIVGQLTQYIDSFFNVFTVSLWIVLENL